jgi:hypothetical protein
MPQLIFDSPATYRIRVLGTLAPYWSERLGGMAITHAANANGFAVATLTGRLVDQAALAGVLNTLYGLCLPLLTVECLVVHQRPGNDGADRLMGHFTSWDVP